MTLERCFLIRKVLRGGRETLAATGRLTITKPVANPKLGGRCELMFRSWGSSCRAREAAGMTPQETSPLGPADYSLGDGIAVGAHVLESEFVPSDANACSCGS